MTDELPSLRNAKHKALVDFRLKGMTTERAAIEAGYSPKTARSQAGQILARPEVKDYMAAMKARASEEAIDIKSKLLQELGNIAFSNVADFTSLGADGQLEIDFSKATREQLSAISSFKTRQRSIYDNRGNHIATEKQSEFRLWDKLRAGELLGKEHGLFKEGETRVVLDVADRLLSARQRVLDATVGQRALGYDDAEDVDQRSGGGREDSG